MGQARVASARSRTAVQVTGVLTLALAAFFFALRPLSITFPGAGLDSSWIVVLGEAAAKSARWGVDYAFTYGPASALMTRYGTPSYLAVILPLSVAVSFVFGLCYVRLLALAGRPSWALGAAILVVIAGTAAAWLDQDSFYYALAGLIYLLDLRRPRWDRVSLLVVALGAAIMGAVSLSKTGYAITAAVLFVVADLRSLWVRRPPLLTFLWVAAFLVSYRAYGQHFADLPTFVRLQWSVASGYGEAMWAVGSRGELWGFACLASAFVFVVVAYGASSASRLDRAFATFGVVLLLLIGFKTGFVRQDTHSQIAWLLLGLLGLAVAAALVLPRSGSGAALLMVASLAVLWIVEPLLLLVESGTAVDRAGIAGLADDYRNEYAAEAGLVSRFVRSPSGFAAEMAVQKQTAWEAIRTKYPLPALAGKVDIVPSEQSSVIANGLDYHPRPSFQDYSTYTQTLMDANAAFLANTPSDWIIFSPGALDERYPTMTEGTLWPELLRRYEPVHRVRDLLTLHRRAEPLPDVLGPPQLSSARIGQPFAVPAGPTFARIGVRKTFLGEVAAALFRPPALAIQVKTADGYTSSYSFIPALGAGGFLLSPLIQDSDDFARLGTGDAQELENKDVVEALVASSPLFRMFYEPEVALEFRPLTVAATEPSAETRPLVEALRKGRPWRQLVRQIGQSQNLQEGRLSVPAPTSLTIPVGGKRHMHVEFGIEDGAWSPGETQGVCFVIAPTADAQGRPAPLFQRCLTPHEVPADRGPQGADLDLPAGLSSVTVSATCPASCDWGWSYWSDITPN